MLIALKQVAEEEQLGHMIEIQAIRSAEPTRSGEAAPVNSPAPNSGAEAPRHDRIAAVITPTIAAKPPDDHNPHPAAIAVANASAANQIPATHA
jgi:hypothetical protein